MKKLSSMLAAFGFAACAMAQGASHQFDVNTKKLYYYPPYKLKASDKLTITTHMKSYIQTEGASNIIFDGINVYDNLSGYGYYIHKSNTKLFHNFHHMVLILIELMLVLLIYFQSMMKQIHHLIPLYCV